MSSWAKKIDPALVIAFFVSVFLWINFSLSEEHIKKIDLKLNLILPQGKSLLRSFPENIEVSYRNRGFNLVGFRFRDSLDIRLDDTGEQYIRPDRIINEISQQFRIPKENISGIDLSDQLVQIEPLASKKLALRTSYIEYSLADGLIELDSIKIEPDSVFVSGPETLLENAGDWFLLNHQLGEISESYSSLLPIQIPYRTVNVDPIKAKVSLEVEKYTEKLINIPIDLELEVPSYKILPESLEIRILVGLSQYDQISDKDFSATLDIVDMHQQKHALRISKAPESIQILHQSTDSASIFIYEENQ